jgi:hypothetical protein
MSALETLSVIASTLDPRAVIAGGYARDTYLGLPTKDIDVWLHSDKHVDLAAELLEDAFRDAGMRATLVEAKDTCMYDRLINGSSDKMLRTVGLIKLIVEDAPVDVLLYHEPLDENLDNLLLSFDVGICRAAINADGARKFHSTFSDDVRNKTLTVERPTKHAARLRDGKFQGYTVVGPAAHLLVAKSETFLVDEAMQLLNDLES